MENIENSLSSDLSASLISLASIKLPFEVTENNLNLIIDDLESKASCEALLACGALLEGRIKNFLNKNKSPEYKKQRIHDAITFYLKAYEKAKDGSVLKSNIKSILWKIRTCSEFDSVKNRLSNLSLSSYHISEQYCCTYSVLPFSFFAPAGEPSVLALNLASEQGESICPNNRL